MRALIPTLAGASALLLLTACSGGGGGSSTPTYATSLAYTNPTSGAYQLVKDSASSGGTLVLDLVSTTGASISGVSFSFSADTGKVAWTPFSDAGTAFNPGSAPKAVASRISGTELQGAVSNKGTASPITPVAATVLAKVTLTLKGNTSAGAITLVDSGKSAILTSSGVTNIVISTGTLSAQ
ncbi:MAG TPA: hypothetical protein VFF77_04030 [Holophagaceae bacterium]|jgi:hypothetical protein|nr:hypothetical protein [Holophagaceae bacterium]